MDDEQSFMKASQPPIPFDQPCLVSTDLAGQIIIDFRMARDGGIGVQGGIMPP
jgi:hypothetical protein